LPRNYKYFSKIKRFIAAHKTARDKNPSRGAGREVQSGAKWCKVVQFATCGFAVNSCLK